MRIDARSTLGPITPRKIGEKVLTEEERRLKEKCQEFETILLQKLVETMQGETKLFGEGLQGDFFRGIFAEALAQELAKDPGLGLADSIVRSMIKQAE